MKHFIRRVAGLTGLLLLLAAPAPADAPAPPNPQLSAALLPLTEDRLYDDATVSVQVVDVATGQVVFQGGVEQAVQPASTMKVLTTAVALRELGPAYRFTTRFLYDGELKADGVLEGNLYVVGTGDPSFSAEALWHMVRDLEYAGVKEIHGNVVFDGSYMEASPYIPGWDKKADIEDGPAYFPSLGAFTLGENVTTVVVGAGAGVGQPARVFTEIPAPGVVELESHVTTGGKGSKRRLTIEREVDGDKVKLKVTGSVPLDGGVERYERAVPSAKAHFASALASELKSRGIKVVKGKWVDGTLPSKDVFDLVTWRSEPLARLAAVTNKHSNNLYAEQILRAVGAEKKKQGTTAAGIEVVKEYLVSLGIPASEFNLVNGSGLSRRTLLRPAHLTAVLVDMARDRRIGHEFASSLAVGGVDGTLWSRFRDGDEVYRVRGKTGTLNGVHCLAGYVDGGDGRSYAFAYLVNDLPYSIARARQAHDRLAETIMGMEPGEAVAQQGDAENTEP